jgi:hypothetical protein
LASQTLRERAESRVCGRVAVWRTTTAGTATTRPGGAATQKGRSMPRLRSLVGLLAALPPCSHPARPLELDGPTHRRSHR